MTNDKIPDVIYANSLGDWFYDYDGYRNKYIRSDLHDRRVTELLEANNRLVEENRRLKAGLQPWQPIDTAPKDGTEIQSWSTELGWHRVYYNIEYQNFGYDWYDEINEDKDFVIFPFITHWMPIPEPPNDPKTPTP